MNDEYTESDSKCLEKVFYRYGEQYNSLIAKIIELMKDVPMKSPAKSLSTELSYVMRNFGEVNNRYAIWDAIENVYQVFLQLYKLQGTHKELFETIETIKQVINSMQIEVLNIYIFSRLTKDIPTYYN